MRRVLRVVTSVALVLAGCSGPKAPLNPPRLVMSDQTDMAIQLFVQATILLANYYHFETMPYPEFQERSARAGFNTLPFMPPETVRATPDLIQVVDVGDSKALTDYVVQKFGYKALVKYYIRTGLRASQLICRNYLLDLDERNQYLEFLRKEFGVGYALASGVLAAVHANATLNNAFLISSSAADQATDIYRDYRFLSVDREAARAVVETAQNKFAEFYMKQVNVATPESTETAGGYTFADALNAVSVIEYQCTREGIRNLLNRSINNTPSNMEVDILTGTVVFSSTQQNTRPTATAVRPLVVAPPPPVSTTGPAVTIVTSSRASPAAAPSRANPVAAPARVASVEVPAYADILDPYNPKTQTKAFVTSLLHGMCVPDREIAAINGGGTAGPVMKALIDIFEASYRPTRNDPARRNGKLDSDEIDEVRGQGPCVAGGGQNYFEKRTFTADANGAEALKRLIVSLNKAQPANPLPPDATLTGARSKIRSVRTDANIHAKLILDLPDAIADEVTPDLMAVLPR